METKVNVSGEDLNSSEKIIYSDAPLKGVVLDRVNEVKAAFGEGIRDYLLSSVKQGLSEEDVARQISEKTGRQINAYSIFVLKKGYHISPTPLTISGHAEIAKHSPLFIEAVEKKLLNIEEMGEVEQILFYTQCFGSRMSLKRLAKDINMPRVELSRIGQDMIADVQRRLGR